MEKGGKRQRRTDRRLKSYVGDEFWQQFFDHVPTKSPESDPIYTIHHSTIHSKGHVSHCTGEDFLGL